KASERKCLRSGLSSLARDCLRSKLSGLAIDGPLGSWKISMAEGESVIANSLPSRENAIGPGWFPERLNSQPSCQVSVCQKRTVFGVLVTNHSPSGLKAKYWPPSNAGRFETRERRGI